MKTKVETIFDHNPTERELRRFGIQREYGDLDKQIERDKAFYEKLEAPQYYYLGLLFSMRGDKKRAEEYFAKATYGQQRLLVQDF
jgi:hypothetical protein